jgi:hypothetical protein
MAIEYKPLNQNRMKAKEVTAVFEWTNEAVLLEQIERLKELLLQGKEYHEDVYNKMSLQFMQKYERTRSFKVINHNEVIVKSKV